MLEAAARIILRYRYVTLIVLIVLTGTMGYFATKVKLSYEAARILPLTDSTYSQYLKFKEKFGEDGTVMVIGFQSDSLWNQKIIAGWYDLTNKIKNIEGIQEVVSIARAFHVLRNDSLHKLDFKPLLNSRPNTQSRIDSLHEEIERLPFYQGLLYNDSTKATVMAITFDQDKINTRGRIEIVGQIKEMSEKFSADNHITLHYSGLPYIRTAVSQKILSEMKMFLFLALFVTALILFDFFRSFYAVLFPMLVVIFGVIWSFGTLQLFGFKITILTSLIAPLIIVIGIPNCILLLNKYQQEYSRHGNQIKALARSIYRIGVSTFFANLTTAIGFLVFSFTHSDVLIEFGIIASINVMLTFLISLILIPIVFSFLPPPSLRQIKHLERKSLNVL